MATPKIPETPTFKPFVWTFGTTTDAKGKTVPDTYEIDIVNIDVLGLAALGRGDAMTGVARLFTPEQYSRLEQSNARFTNEVLWDFLEQLTQHISGVALGESKASPRSSKSTPRPSKPTSARSTKSASGKPSARKR